MVLTVEQVQYLRSIRGSPNPEHRQKVASQYSIEELRATFPTASDSALAAIQGGHLQAMPEYSEPETQSKYGITAQRASEISSQMASTGQQLYTEQALKGEWLGFAAQPGIPVYEKTPEGKRLLGYQQGSTMSWGQPTQRENVGGKIVEVERPVFGTGGVESVMIQGKPGDWKPTSKEVSVISKKGETIPEKTIVSVSRGVESQVSYTTKLGKEWPEKVEHWDFGFEDFFYKLPGGKQLPKTPEVVGGLSDFEKRPGYTGEIFAGMPEQKHTLQIGIFSIPIKESETFSPTYKQAGTFFGGRGAYAGYEGLGFAGGVGAGLLEAPRDIELFGRGLIIHPSETIMEMPSGYYSAAKTFYAGGFESGKLFGSFAGQSLLFSGFGKLVGKGISEVEFLGKERVPGEEVFDPYALKALEEGRTVYPQSPGGVLEMLFKFKKRSPKGKGEIVHTTSVIFERETFAKTGASETPILLGTPKGLATPTFLRLLGSEYSSIGLSFNPLDVFKGGKPAVYEILFEEPIGRIPKKYRGSYAKAQEFFGTSRTKLGKQGSFRKSELLPAKAPKGKAFISAAAEFGKKETEAGPVAGTKLKRLYSSKVGIWEKLTGFKQYTEVLGTKVHMFKYKALKEGEIAKNVLTGEDLSRIASENYRDLVSRPSLILAPTPIFYQGKGKYSASRSLSSSSKMLSSSIFKPSVSRQKSIVSRTFSSQVSKPSGSLIKPSIISIPKVPSKPKNYVPPSTTEYVPYVPPSYTPPPSKHKYTPPPPPPPPPSLIIYRPPPTTKKKTTYFQSRKRLKISEKRLPGWLTFVKHRGKFFQVGKVSSFAKAQRKGVAETIGTSARTFKLLGVPFEVEEEEGSYAIPLDIFKPKKGLTYVQKTGKTILSRKEYENIRNPPDLMFYPKKKRRGK